MGERNDYRLLVGKSEGKIPLGRPIRRWENNIQIDCIEIALSELDWTGLTKNRYRWKAFGFHKCLEIFEWLHSWWPQG
jgi:hypothetical protein